jgi:hypothetical protein
VIDRGRHYALFRGPIATYFGAHSNLLMFQVPALN